MRVLYVLNDLRGGASRGIYEMLSAAPRGTIEAYAVAPPGPAAANTVAPLFRDLRLLPIPWWNLKTELDPLRQLAIGIGQTRRGWNEKRATEAILDVIREWKIDLVHSGTSLTLAGATAARRADVPHIWHIKETIGSRGRVQFSLRDEELVHRFEGLSERVLCMSEFIAEPFRRHGSAKTEVIPDGVALAHYRRPGSQALRERLCCDCDTPLIGMVAGLSSVWKRHELFIRMAGLLSNRLPGSRFVIVGGRPGSARWPYDLAARYADSLQDLARSLVSMEALQFLEHVPDPGDIMRSLDILVHPCEIEPFGRIAIEAMAASTPVVGPNEGGIAETVIHEETGLLVPPCDPAALADAVERLISDSALRARLGAGGLSRVERYYRIEDHLHQVLNVYQGVISTGAIS